MVAMAVLLAAQVCLAAAVAQDDVADGEDAAAAIDSRGRLLLTSFTDDVTTVSADFRQTLYDRDGNVKEVSTGFTRIARPERFLWVYSEPYEQRIIADGVNLWLYDVDLDQVTVKPQREALGRSPAEILGGDAGALAAFAYQGAFERDDILWVQLQPRDNDTDFEGVRLGFEGERLAGMELADSLGQITRIDFSRVALDAPIPDATFRFEPPDGVDVIGTVSTPAFEGLGALQ